MFRGMPRIALNDDTTTRCPAFCSRKISIAASHCASAATMFVSTVCLLASKYPLPTGWPLPSPALTTTRSSPPSSSTQGSARRSEEHTSELQSRENLVCRLLLEKKKKNNLYKHASITDSQL